MYPSVPAIVFLIFFKTFDTSPCEVPGELKLEVTVQSMLVAPSPGCGVKMISKVLAKVVQLSPKCIGLLREYSPKGFWVEAWRSNQMT